LAEIGEIVFAVERAVTEQDLRGERIVITAGATREFLDPVRCMTNRSSGKMGYALAERAALRGADVVLLSGPTGITPPLGVRVTPFVTALELRQALHDTLEREEDTEKGQKTVLIMAAAVTDFRPEVQSVTKLKQSKSVEQTLTLVPNPDLLKELGEWRAQPSHSVALTLVGFAAETGTDEEILRYAQEKMERKKVDLLVANRVEEGFERDENRVWILSRAGSVRELPSAQKRVIADGILDAVVQWKGRKG
jgi:phosphopantothenoylcysteine decarboxylase/phosphopantothenate--cysteine ligase